MAQVVLLSILIATVAIPARAAREKNPKKGLRKAILYVALYNAFYLFLLIFVYVRLL
jgi:hypothetical protein